MIINSFNMFEVSPKIIGIGQEEKRLKRPANKNVEFLGWQPDSVLVEYYARCKAFSTGLCSRDGLRFPRP